MIECTKATTTTWKYLFNFNYTMWL